MLVSVPQMLNAVGFMPAPKSRTSATWCASRLMTASVGILSVDAVADADALMQVAFSAHTVSAGHEKRASMQRTALGRGEHAYTMPAPVALLMHVCRGAHEMPLPQSFDRKGTADTLQTSIATMNNDAFGFIVLIVLLCCLAWLYFYYLLLLMIKMVII
jgi:hypothetical protein